MGHTEQKKKEKKKDYFGILGDSASKKEDYLWHQSQTCRIPHLGGMAKVEPMVEPHPPGDPTPHIPQCNIGKENLKQYHADFLNQFPISDYFLDTPLSMLMCHCSRLVLLFAHTPLYIAKAGSYLSRSTCLNNKI